MTTLDLAISSLPRSRFVARPHWSLWIGRCLSGIPSLLMLFSASAKLAHAPQVVDAFQGQFGYPLAAITPIGLLEASCVVLYLIPGTATLGVVLMTAYLGGAVATHVRVLDPTAVTPAVLGVLAWVGLWLRHPRLAALLPPRRGYHQATVQ